MTDTPALLRGVEICVFDAYGTLFDVHAPAAALAPRIGPDADRLSQIWRRKQLEYTWLRSLMDAYVDFWSVTTDALDYALAATGGTAAPYRDELLEMYRSLDAYADAADLLGRLKARGLPRAILSNGSPGMLETAVASAGLAEQLDGVLSVDTVGVFKPHPLCYRLALDRFGVDKAQVLFFSSNGWDVAGAGAFGFRTVWVNRFDQAAERLTASPTHVFPSLAAVTDLIEPG